MEKFAEYPEIIAGAGIGIVIFIILGILFVFWLFNIFCMMMGAKVANISNRSFGKAFVASLLIAWLGGAVIGGLSLLHPLLGLAGLIFVPAIFIKMVYSCDLGQAIIAYIINIITSITLTIVLILTLTFGLGLSIDKLKKQSNEDNKEKKTIEVQK